MSKTHSAATAQAATPAERLARFCELQRRAYQLLAASPAGHRQYWSRNLRKRRAHGTVSPR